MKTSENYIKTHSKYCDYKSIVSLSYSQSKIECSVCFQCFQALPLMIFKSFNEASETFEGFLAAWTTVISPT